MKNHSIKKTLSLVLVFVLIAAAALTGCSGAPAETTAPPAELQPFTILTVNLNAELTDIGSCENVIDLTIVDKEGTEHLYEIHTDEEMVGFALIAHELIEGEEGPYGMYIKSVLGQKLDYETDKMYWSFYVNGEYAMTGVDQTPILEGEQYMLKAEAAE